MRLTASWAEAGRVGLWTKADSLTHFDNFIANRCSRAPVAPALFVRMPVVKVRKVRMPMHKRCMAMPMHVRLA